MSTDGQCIKWHRNGAENSNRLSTDRRTIAYSEREHEFTFAKKPYVL